MDRLVHSIRSALSVRRASSPGSVGSEPSAGGGGTPSRDADVTQKILRTFPVRAIQSSSSCHFVLKLESRSGVRTPFFGFPNPSFSPDRSVNRTRPGLPERRNHVTNRAHRGREGPLAAGARAQSRRPRRIRSGPQPPGDGARSWARPGMGGRTLEGCSTVGPRCLLGSGSATRPGVAPNRWNAQSSPSRRSGSDRLLSFPLPDARAPRAPGRASAHRCGKADDSR